MGLIEVNVLTLTFTVQRQQAHSINAFFVIESGQLLGHMSADDNCLNKNR